MNVYEDYRCKVNKMLRCVSYLSFACDIWPSADNNRSLLRLTALFIDKDMIPKYVVAAATPIKTRHRAENTGALLVEVLSSFSINENKIHMFVRDVASLTVATTNLLNMKSWDCFAHKIQQVKNFRFIHHLKPMCLINLLRQ